MTTPRTPIYLDEIRQRNEERRQNAAQCREARLFGIPLQRLEASIEDVDALLKLVEWIGFKDIPLEKKPPCDRCHQRGKFIFEDLCVDYWTGLRIEYERIIRARQSEPLVLQVMRKKNEERRRLKEKVVPGPFKLAERGTEDTKHYGTIIETNIETNTAFGWGIKVRVWSMQKEENFEGDAAPSEREPEEAWSHWASGGHYESVADLDTANWIIHARSDNVEGDVDALLVEAERLQERLNWRDNNPGQTHFEGCWRDHRGCAMEKIRVMGEALNLGPRLHELGIQASMEPRPLERGNVRARI